jgi:hypothetical protein
MDVVILSETRREPILGGLVARVPAGHGLRENAGIHQANYVLIILKRRCGINFSSAFLF